MGTQTCRQSGASYGPCTGCGSEEADGPLPVVQDLGGNPCGDCDGCCDGESCIPYAGQSSGKCGSRGEICAGCGPNKNCDTGSGMCVDVMAGGCSAANCASGCCKMVSGTPTCFTDQPAACGTGGGQCTQCTYGVTCSGGCTQMIDGNAQFKVIVTKASVYNTDVGGNCWDNYLGLGCAQPDIKVCFGYQSGATVVEGCNKELVHVSANATVIDDAVWNETDGLVTAGGTPFLITGSYFVLGGKVRVTVYDVDDFNADDIIAQAYITAQSSYFDAYALSAFGRATGITFELR